MSFPWKGWATATVLVRAQIGIGEFLVLVNHLRAWATLDDVTIRRQAAVADAFRVVGDVDQRGGECQSATVGWIGMAGGGVSEINVVRRRPVNTSVFERNQLVSESPFAPPQTDDMPRSVIITDANAFRMPHKCVVCGKDVSELFAYIQDHLPLVGPGVGLVRTIQVAIPYCAEHRKAFQKRFRNLRIAQGIVYVILVICAFTIFVEPVRASFGWDPKPGLVSGVVGGVLFLFLVITVFCIKPFLYDVFIKRSGNHIRIKSRSKVFIKNVIEANQAAVQ